MTIARCEIEEKIRETGVTTTVHSQVTGNFVIYIILDVGHLQKCVSTDPSLISLLYLQYTCVKGLDYSSGYAYVM